MKITLSFEFGKGHTQVTLKGRIYGLYCSKAQGQGVFLQGAFMLHIFTYGHWFRNQCSVRFTEMQLKPNHILYIKYFYISVTVISTITSQEEGPGFRF